MIRVTRNGKKITVPNELIADFQGHCRSRNVRPGREYQVYKNKAVTYDFDPQSVNFVKKLADDFNALMMQKPKDEAAKPAEDEPKEDEPQAEQG